MKKTILIVVLIFALMCVMTGCFVDNTDNSALGKAPYTWDADALSDSFNNGNATADDVGKKLFDENLVPMLRAVNSDVKLCAGYADTLSRIDYLAQKIAVSEDVCVKAEDIIKLVKNYFDASVSVFDIELNADGKTYSFDSDKNEVTLLKNSNSKTFDFRYVGTEYKDDVFTVKTVLREDTPDEFFCDFTFTKSSLSGFCVKTNYPYSFRTSSYDIEDEASCSLGEYCNVLYNQMDLWYGKAFSAQDKLSLADMIDFTLNYSVVSCELTERDITPEQLSERILRCFGETVDTNSSEAHQSEYYNADNNTFHKILNGGGEPGPCYISKILSDENGCITMSIIFRLVNDSDGSEDITDIGDFVFKPDGKNGLIFSSFVDKR